MSAVSGDHDDDEDGSKKDGVGVPQLIVDTGSPTESQAVQTLAKGILPTAEEVYLKTKLVFAQNKRICLSHCHGIFYRCNGVLVLFSIFFSVQISHIARSIMAVGRKTSIQCLLFKSAFCQVKLCS